MMAIILRTDNDLYIVKWVMIDRPLLYYCKIYVRGKTIKIKKVK